ncbi:amino acid ABC transporter permease [Nordella sp. HKS 07]|uniref:amino acid ABC transporter permease n=1 Tax=Nordella sp. HKS 07 TaxID=2712222 RepID=UPI001FEED7A4|nr:amino acid ABC transporter permease [Nordella sp. HKS 07]
MGALPTLPRRTDGLSLAALLFAAFCVLCAWGATRVVGAALDHLQVDQGVAWGIIFFLTIAGTAALFWPAFRSWTFSNRARAALSADNIVEARIDAASARDWAYLTFGWGAAALMLLGFASFIMANNAGVGKTFFYLPLILDKWDLVVRAFWENVKIFVIAEILVLIWGLIVAVARLMPGPAGQPVRLLAIAYCDIFRGLPAVLTLYLIGFGLPISGLPDLIIPPIVGLFVDLDGMTAGEIKQYTRIPLFWYCILALTLTYGAYVAEVYRAGIDSIHPSQWAASRSLGLSYLQTLRYVIVPQAVRRIVAPLLNDFIGLQKDTALVQVIGVVDAFNQSKIIASNAFNLSAVTIVAIIFVLITIPQARFVDNLLERDQARRRAAS